MRDRFDFFIKRDNAYVLSSIFLLLITTDFISKIGAHQDNVFRNSSVILKILFQLSIVIYIAKYAVGDGFKILKFIVIIGLSFLIGQFVSKSDTSFVSRVIDNSKVLNWYLFIFILAAGYRTFEKKSNLINAQKENLFQVFEIVFILNSICIIIGTLFSFDLFASYNYGRFGYNGFLRNPTHASFIYIIYFIYFYYKYVLSPTNKYKYLLISSFFIPFLLGTKAVVFFLGLFLIYYILKKKLYQFLIVGLIVFILAVINFDFFLNTFIKKYFLVLYKAYHENGLLSMLFSLRNESIQNVFIPYITKYWTFLNPFFGGAEFNLYRTELEIIDFFWFFGILGTAIYFFIFNKFVIGKEFFIRFKLLLLLLLVVFLAGSFFSSAPVMLFFYVLCLFLKDIYSVGRT
jgi:hypothetical protein